MQASPRIRYNKEGMMFAVSTIDNGIKILANTDGLHLLHSLEAPRSASETVAKPSPISTMGASGNAGTSVGIADRGAPMTTIIGMNGDSRSLADVKPRIVDESMEKSKIWKLTEINELSQCRSLRLPDNLLPTRVSRLIYTHSGLAILALASNAMHKLWKWQRNERNLAGKNDLYVISASGGKISLFKMMTFKTMTTFMPPPPAATFLAFHPQDNNIIAIGMEDYSIQIYNVRVDEVKSKIKGHQKRVTGLAFSNVLNVLVSSDADA
ncbi:Topless-like [Thalictrum thalictroides]|uniref:Topless-like n=1 Tax=Thalictrum thalictroides TaxID=46969 RepID=A0A7J6WLT2_THATH|nr:Topless-like [Thalictrum thalictroides]